jgi:hypothetical protein
MGGTQSKGRWFLHLFQFVILISLVGAIQDNPWFIAGIDADWTEGRPKGASAAIELEVDSGVPHGTINIDGYFTFKAWQNERNDTTVPILKDDTNQTFSLDVATLGEVQDEVSFLSQFVVLLSVILLGMMIFGVEKRAWLGAIISLLVLWLFISIAFRSPLGYLSEFDGLGEGATYEGGESSLHPTFETTTSYSPDEVNISFVSGSYDLGLVDSSELDSVISEPPGTDHPSYIQMEGNMYFKWGQFVVELGFAWLILFAIAPMVMRISEWASVEKPLRL